MVLVGTQLSVLGSYLPPVFTGTVAELPPHTIISVPVHTAVWYVLPLGTSVMLVSVQVLSMHPYDIVGRI